MVVVGDATGHGLKAGNMVTATKGLLIMLSNQENVEDILISANSAIKRMNLPMITMCLAVARIRGNTLWYSSAGMPPLLVYRAKTGQCEQHVLKAMPLGAVEQFSVCTHLTHTFLRRCSRDEQRGLHEVFNETVTRTHRQYYAFPSKRMPANLQKASFAACTRWKSMGEEILC